MDEILSLANANGKFVGTKHLPTLHKRQKFDLLPFVEAKSKWIAVEIRFAHQQYTIAHISLNAIDDPASFHADKSEEDKDALYQERLAKYQKARDTYSALIQKEFERRAKDKKIKLSVRAIESTIQPVLPAPVAPMQQRLFADAWPNSFGYIIDRFPRRPFVSNDLEKGVTVRSLPQCANWRYIQYNSPVSDHLLIIDYDAPESVDINDVIKGLPVPTWISRTPGTNRGHIAWALATPVCTTSAAKQKPLQYLARIEEGFRKHVDGDKGFSGLLTKNPVHDAWDVQWIEPKAYSLDELAASVKIDRYTSKKKAEAIEPVGLGRKVLTFERSRHWAYSAVSDYWTLGEDAWHAAVRSKADAINSGFDVPLPVAHCKAIAKSIAKWVWARFTPLTKHQLVMATHTPEVQSMRGRASGASRLAASAEKRSTAISMASSGCSTREIAAALGVNQSTVVRWLG